jgi:hypothetical protein
LRGQDKEYKRRDVQPLLVMAQQPFQLKHPKVFVPANEKEWGWPDAIPAEVLFDPLSTVSATYGVAFQTQFRKNNNVWSSRPAIFVIDAEGVLRHVASRRDEDIRENGIFPIVDEFQAQRQLIAALQAKGGAVGDAARMALGPVGTQTKTAVLALAEALKEEAAQVRVGAAVALYWIAAEAPAAAAALAGALQDGDNRVRRFSGQALARMGPGARSAVPALIRALVDEDARVRAAASSALAQIGPDAAAGLVEALQKHKEARIRATAAATLLTIPVQASVAVPALIGAIKDADTAVRLAAVSALGRFGPAARDAVPALLEALKENDLRDAARQSLKAIDAQAAKKAGIP